MSDITKIKAPIIDEMKQFEEVFSKSIKSKVPLLNIITNYILRRKSKQMRPLFVFLSAKLNGEINPKTYTAASLIELLYTAALVHEDVVDEPFEKKRFMSINALWRSKIAVLMGDYMLAKGLLIAVENKAYDLLEIISDAVREISEGELLQLQRSRTINISREQYFEIIRKKTAVLISACTACGAQSVGSDAEIVAKMKQFGEFIGIAFQLKDDLLDYQTTGIIGKPIGNNIKKRKLTLPLVFTLETSSKDEIKYILKTISKHNRDSNKIQNIVDFVTKKGGLEFTEKKMIEYRDNALTILNSYHESEVKTSLLILMNDTLSRKN